MVKAEDHTAGVGAIRHISYARNRHLRHDDLPAVLLNLPGERIDRIDVHRVHGARLAVLGLHDPAVDAVALARGHQPIGLGTLPL
jgi:hypothetical protein